MENMWLIKIYDFMQQKSGVKSWHLHIVMGSNVKENDLFADVKSLTSGIISECALLLHLLILLSV